VEKKAVDNGLTHFPGDPAQENSVAEKIPVIDEEACIGCGACEEICPEVFRMNDSLGFALVVNPGGADPDKIEEAIEACPVNCISWSED
jgi:ferredoxin